MHTSVTEYTTKNIIVKQLYRVTKVKSRHYVKFISEPKLVCVCVCVCVCVYVCALQITSISGIVARDTLTQTHVALRILVLTLQCPIIHHEVAVVFYGIMIAITSDSLISKQGTENPGNVIL